MRPPWPLDLLTLLGQLALGLALLLAAGSLLRWLLFDDDRPGPTSGPGSPRP